MSVKTLLKYLDEDGIVMVGAEVRSEIILSANHRKAKPS